MQVQNVNDAYSYIIQYTTLSEQFWLLENIQKNIKENMLSPTLNTVGRTSIGLEQQFPVYSMGDILVSSREELYDE